MAKITSSPLTFVDTTDSRKFEVHISSNLPQVQTYNQNTKTYSPDWSKTELNLQASIYLDSTDITENIKDSDVEWYKNTISTATKISNGKTLMINTNVLSAEPIITYICQAKYQNLTTGTRIDFTRIDSGINGSAGASAPAVQAQYSVDGSAWTATLNAASHKYVRYSYDGGKTWTTKIKMVGEDGTSVAIKGTATLVTAVSGTNYYTVTYGGSSITTAALGDSYLYNGYLYVCSELRDGDDYFINVGKIQGPQGNDGISEYVYIRYSPKANPSDSDMKPTPDSTTTHIGICVSTVTPAPQTASSYTWSKFVGESAKSIVLSGDSQIFKGSKTTPITYTPSTIRITANRINIPTTTALIWSYNYNDNNGWTTVKPDSVAINGDVATITGSSLTTNSLTIKVSDGSVEDIFTVYKAFDGTDGVNGTKGDSASMSFLTNENVTLGANANGIITSATITTNVVAYNGTTKTTPTIGTISGLPTGMTAKIGIATNSEVPIVFTITNSNLGSTSNNNGSITIPVNGPVYTNLILTWSKVNSGAKGDKGDKGDTGRGVSKITEYYLATTSSSGVTTATSGWTTTVQSIDATKKYLWNYEIVTYTDNTTSTTSPIIIGAFGNTGSAGATGKGIKSVTEYYLATTLSTGVTTSTAGWTTTMQSLTSTNKYLWNYELITYTDNTTSTINPVIIGVYGDKGVQGDKGNQGDRGVGISSVTVTYGTSTSASIQPTSWQTTIPTVAEGSYLWTRTITDYTDTSIADTVTLTYAKQGAKGSTGSAGTSVTVSSIQYQAGTSATTAPTGTWSNSVVTVAEGSYLWTKTMFSDGKVAYGVAKQGEKGSAGAPASLVDITPSALYFKSTTGKDGTFTPDYIYLYPRFQTVTFSKWEYSVNGGVTWVAASGANGLTISTYNSVANTLRIAKTSTLYTDTITSISFRCVSSNVSVYDTVSIAKLFDVDVEEINTKITNSLAEVKTTTDSIASKVSATETSIKTTNNNVTSLTTRVSTAEQKITPSAIVSTVRQSADYTNDLGQKVSTNEIISKINQTAESVMISANKIGLLGATNIPDLTADKIKGGTLTLGGSDAATQNGQILVKNASNEDMISINKYGMAIADGNLTIVDESELNEYGGWSSYSHTKLKTTGMESMYIARNSSAEYHAELDAVDGLTMEAMGGMNANPYYLYLGPTRDYISDYATEMKFYDHLIMTDGTINADIPNNVIADISIDEFVLPKANIILQDTAQKNIMFQNASEELRACMLYAGANDSTTVMGAWDTTKSKPVFTYSTDDKFYILGSEAITKSMMSNSVGERGYQKLPSGLIIQWGYQGSALTVSGNYNITSGNITLPIAFPNSFTGVFCNVIEVDSGNLSGYYNLTAKANGLTGFTWKAYNYFNNYGSSILFSWLAIGY